jgi:RimJ/RimL family protein N-acetyltransferase
MALVVREMELAEVGVIIDYFHSASAEYLELLGVDPTRLPAPEHWRRRYETECGLGYRERSTILVLWELDSVVVGFSTADKIRYGAQANMHLHIVDPERRRVGLGSECVRRTAAIYFEALELQRLFCEPNAFNIAANRTLQRAGFTYVKTHMTVPGPLNYHQAVTRWVFERA